MGKTLKDLDPEDHAGALDAIDSMNNPKTPFSTTRHHSINIWNQSSTNTITGYLLAIDMTGRNVQEEAKKKGLPWSIAKGSNHIPKSKISDPHNVHLWLSVNGEMKQSDSTELMLFQIPRQLSDISRVMGLEKGDIVLTGTPKGVGPVVTGDRMQAGLKVDGNDLPEASIDVEVADKPGPYEFSET